MTTRRPAATGPCQTKIIGTRLTTRSRSTTAPQEGSSTGRSSDVVVERISSVSNFRSQARELISNGGVDHTLRVPAREERGGQSILPEEQLHPQPKLGPRRDGRAISSWRSASASLASAGNAASGMRRCPRSHRRSPRSRPSPPTRLRRPRRRARPARRRRAFPSATVERLAAAISRRARSPLGRAPLPGRRG